MTSRRNLPQPPSKPGKATPTHTLLRARLERLHEGHLAQHRPAQAEVVSMVMADLAERDAHGTQKYGTTHQHDNGRDHTIDAYQELMDAIVYLEAQVQARPTPLIRQAGSYATKALMLIAEELKQQETQEDPQ